MRNKLAMFVSIVGVFVVLGLVGHDDRQINLEETMSSTCTATAHGLGQYADQCLTLISQIEADGHHEVLSNDQGYYWTEEHK